MTLDEHIHKAEEDAKMAEFDTEWGIGNYFIDRTEALEYAKECRQIAEWLKDYKRLKEQEPCEDAISRQAVLDMLEDINAETEGVGFYYEHYVDYVKYLSSVKPQEKTGHWKRISMDRYTTHAQYWYKCDRCGEDNLGNTDWCPNCGARMFEPQERSE